MAPADVERLRSAGLQATSARVAILDVVRSGERPGRVGDHHLVCRRCGVAADVDCTAGQAPCLEPASRSGYLVHEAEVTFWGLCPRCQQAAPDGPGRHSRPAGF